MIPTAPILVCLALALLGLFMILSAPALRMLRRGWFFSLVVAGLAFGVISDRVGFHIMTETGIYDAGSFFDYSSNTAHVRWGYQPYVKGSRFRWFYKYKYGSDEMGPYELPSCPVEDCAADFKLEVPEGQEWKSVIFIGYAEYVAPPVVTTNGVYHLSGVMRTMDGSQRYVTPLVEIVVNLEDGSTQTLTPTNTPGGKK
ncbi:MAG: hypothetical protein IKC80_10080 [Kiritimatiellae bacterium]|nr:hypothetical protein [Kiritimatiellia bacterium]